MGNDESYNGTTPGLPKDHWIHKAMAKETARHAKKAAKSDGDGDNHFIQGAIKRPGALHAKLGVPQGQKIPAKKMKQAENSSSPLERKEANFAEELKGFNKK